MWQMKTAVTEKGNDVVNTLMFQGEITRKII